MRSCGLTTAAAWQTDPREYSEFTTGQTTLSAAPDQPLIGVVVVEANGPVVRYFARYTAEAATFESDDALRAALAVVGAWRDLEWDTLAEDWDRARHESPPTPPIYQ